MDINAINEVNDCLKRIRQQEDSAYEDLHAIIGVRVKFIAMKFLNNESDADDLVQDFWYNMPEYAMKCVLVSNCYAYLLKIIENEARTILKKAKKEPEFINFDDIQEFRNLGVGISERSESDDLDVAIGKAINMLTKSQREIFSLTYFYGRTTREIAKLLLLSRTTVSTELNNSIETIREQLQLVGYIINL